MHVNVHKDLLGTFDVIMALNMSESIIYNKSTIKNCTKLLKEGGYFILWSPARTALYNGLTPGIRKWDRHNKHIIQKLITKCYSLVKLRYFNLVRTEPNSENIPGAYDKIMEVFHFPEKPPPQPDGLSAIIVGLKVSSF
jgi:hypothetical protein